MKGYSYKNFPVRASAVWVMSRASHVSVRNEGVEAFVESWDNDNVSSQWYNEVHYYDGTEKTIEWIFVLDTLNHSFWPDPGSSKWAITYRGKTYSGYMALAASLKRSVEEGIPITDPKFLAYIDEETLGYIFRGEGSIPMLRERTENLREYGRIVLEKWNGNVLSMLEEAQPRVLGEKSFLSNSNKDYLCMKVSAPALVDIVVNSFKSFQDQAVYEGRTVYFWKRAQLLAADLHNAFSVQHTQSRVSIVDLDILTAFADYKLPQVLRHLGIIKYSSELAGKIESCQLIVSGSSEEVEIRAATVYAVEEIRDSLAKQGITVTSVAIDHYLWELGQRDEFRQYPYHRCRTIFY